MVISKLGFGIRDGFTFSIHNLSALCELWTICHVKTLAYYVDIMHFLVPTDELITHISERVNLINVALKTWTQMFRHPWKPQKTHTRTFLSNRSEFVPCCMRNVEIFFKLCIKVFYQVLISKFGLQTDLFCSSNWWGSYRDNLTSHLSNLSHLSSQASQLAVIYWQKFAIVSLHLHT